VEVSETHSKTYVLGVTKRLRMATYRLEVPHRLAYRNCAVLTIWVKLAVLPTSQIAKGVTKIEQLNIEGKRSGKGFVVHKSMLASALSRVLAELQHTVRQ